MEEVKLGVITLHPIAPLRDEFYEVLEDCQHAGCIVDIYFLDFATILKKHGYTLKIYKDGDSHR